MLSRRFSCPCQFMCVASPFPWFFFFKNPATTEIYTLSLHDALPIFGVTLAPTMIRASEKINVIPARAELGVDCRVPPEHGEEHTAERHPPVHIVCRLLLEKKKNSAIKHAPRECSAYCSARYHAHGLG